MIPNLVNAIKFSQAPLKLTNLDMAIAELSAIASKVSAPDSEVDEGLRTAANMSFTEIIVYLNKLKQIGSGIPDTLTGIPTETDINNIVNTGLIDNQLFINSLC